MRNRKMPLSLLCMVLVLVMLTACGGTPSTTTQTTVTAPGATTTASLATTTAASTEPVKLTFFNTSAEVNTVFENLFLTYKELNPNVTIELIPTPIGGEQIQKFQSLLASGEAATMANLDPGNILQYKDYFLDLESEKAAFVELANPGVVEASLLDGVFLGIPWTGQGYGLLYNTKVVNQAVGGNFDPTTIKTRNDLEALLQKIDAIGIAPVMLHGADWSMGAHLQGLAYSLQTNDVAKNKEFLFGLQKGTQTLTDNAVYNGMLDSFDLLVKYNARKEDPLVADYNKDCADFATGKAGLFFMGDWSWAVINTLEGRDQEFGLIPFPISNNPDDYGNTQIAFSYPKLFSIDKSSATAAEQAAAMTFLKWFVSSEQGQKAIVEEMGLNLPYKDVKAVSTNIMSNAVSKYVSEGKSINIGVINYMPADFWAQTGASMQKYMTGRTDRATLIKEVQDYWISVGNK